nr:MAG TPA: hypothetical protein [Caudoviricetes sp.]
MSDVDKLVLTGALITSTVLIIIAFLVAKMDD